MASTKPPIPAAAEPKYSLHFDTWNTSASGHQKAENRMGGSTGWRESRTIKLSHQFCSGNDGGRRVSDQVGAGSEHWDEKVNSLTPKGFREGARCSIIDMLRAQNTKPSVITTDKLIESRTKDDEVKGEKGKVTETRKGIFDGLVIYINGTTYPLISDHKLKHLLTKNGAKISIHLGRKQVTHVILGRPNGQTGVRSGAGGGLAATKIQKEINRVGGCGVKYVIADWVLGSIRAGKRLPEAQFKNLHVAPENQRSVYGIFQKTSSM